MARKNVEPAGPAGASRRDDVPVKFDRVLAGKLKHIIERRGGTMSQYISDLCRARIEKDYAAVVREMAKEVEND